MTHFFVFTTYCTCAQSQTGDTNIEWCGIFPGWRQRKNEAKFAKHKFAEVFLKYFLRSTFQNSQSVIKYSQSVSRVSAPINCVCLCVCVCLVHREIATLNTWKASSVLKKPHKVHRIYWVQLKLTHELHFSCIVCNITKNKYFFVWAEWNHCSNHCLFDDCFFHFKFLLKFSFYVCWAKTDFVSEPQFSLLWQ